MIHLAGEIKTKLSGITVKTTKWELVELGIRGGASANIIAELTKTQALTLARLLTEAVEELDGEDDG